MHYVIMTSVGLYPEDAITYPLAVYHSAEEADLGVKKLDWWQSWGERAYDSELDEAVEHILWLYTVNAPVRMPMFDLSSDYASYYVEEV